MAKTSDIKFITTKSCLIFHNWIQKLNQNIILGSTWLSVLNSNCELGLGIHNQEIGSMYPELVLWIHIIIYLSAWELIHEFKKPLASMNSYIWPLNFHAYGYHQDMPWPFDVSWLCIMNIPCFIHEFIPKNEFSNIHSGIPRFQIMAKQQIKKNCDLLLL